MKLQKIATCAGLIAGGFLSLSTNPAQAFNFTTNYQADLTGNNQAKGNIWLQSVEAGEQVINDFVLVNSATILQNDFYTTGNTGAASSDRGDEASGVKKEDPTSADIVASLGNLNLNNIIDTEDSGKFKINLFFEEAVRSLFFWERGMNSILGIQAIDTTGNVLGNFLEINSRNWANAGFKINTTEVSGSQKVGSLGVTTKDLGVSNAISGIQVISKANYNGPDFKVVGSTASVPEPATLAGLGLVGGALAVSRRRKSQKAS